VAVHPEFIHTALKDVYDVPALARELRVAETVGR
jgi:hypothetical protein